MKMKSHILLMLFLVSTSAIAADYDASIQFAHKITLSVPVTGEVSQVNIRKGDFVTNGQTLLSLNTTPFQAAVTKADSQVKKMATLQKEAERDYQQLTELYDRGVLSKVELENGQLSLQRASADYAAAEAALTQAKYDLEHAVIKAPFDGVTLDVHVKAHETINNSETIVPLLTVAEKNKYTAHAMVSLSALNKLTLGSKGKVSIGNKNYNGQIASIAFEPETNSKGEKRYEVQIEFDSQGNLIRAGETARVSF